MPAPATARTKAQQRVLRWFEESQRPFPWRDTRDPYRILVAEVMLQQTQTGRAVPIYEAFLKRFPNVETLAHAPAMEVIRAWKGLGYNKRAVALQDAAQQIVREGRFPSTLRQLRALPGVAAYTSAAVACFAFDEQVPVVDVNVKRVLARAANGTEPESVPTTGAERLASVWLPAGEAYRWNQALMDIGATLCRADKPLCARCPMNAVCKYFARGRHKRPRARSAKISEPFEGSTRQRRGGIVDALRDSATTGITLAALSKAIHPKGTDRSHVWLVELLTGLERDGLITMSESARRGASRGKVRLPE